MQNTFHFVFRNPTLRKVTFILSKSFEILPGRPAFASLRNELEALEEIRCWGFPPYTEGVSPYVGNFRFAWNNWKQIFSERNFHQLKVAVSSATKQLEYCLTNQIFAVSGPTEHCSIFHFPFVRPSSVRHRCDISTFLDILTVYTMKTIYFLNAYHLGW